MEEGRLGEKLSNSVTVERKCMEDLLEQAATVSCRKPIGSLVRKEKTFVYSDLTG
jgi:hypothetical protein